MPEPGRRPSTGITQLRRYHAPLRLPQGPRLTVSDHPGWWPRPHHLCGSHTLPRRPCAHADPTTPAEEDGFSGRLLRRPPTAFPLWKEGRLQRETFEACSGFTCLSACALAPWLRQGVLRRLQPGDHSPRLLQWLPGRTDNSPDGTRTRWPSGPRRSLRDLQLSSP